MNKSILPSKRFLIRGGIAVLALIIILVVQAKWFRNIFQKKDKSIVASTTVGDIITEDTNGNGIADWEEKLWGLDPTVLYTNGIPNKQIIEDKKKVLGVNADQDDQNLDDTDRLARELFTLTAALGQSDEVDSQTLASISQKLGSYVNIKSVNNQYSLRDLTTTQTNVANLNAYYSSMQKVFAKYDTDTPDIEVLATAIQNEDSSGLAQLSISAQTYQNIAKELKSVKVPVGLAQDHLSIINGFSGIATSFTYITQLDDNSLASLVGVAIYKRYSTSLNTAIANMNAYLTQYGII